MMNGTQAMFRRDDTVYAAKFGDRNCTIDLRTFQVIESTDEPTHTNNSFLGASNIIESLTDSHSLGGSDCEGEGCSQCQPEGLEEEILENLGLDYCDEKLVLTLRSWKQGGYEKDDFARGGTIIIVMI